MNRPAYLKAREIHRILAACGMECSETLAGEIEAYLYLLAKWNERINLTGVRNPFDQLKVLFCESFMAASLLKPEDGPVLDVGSGAGFPGMAMGLFRRELPMILLEPRAKRAAFLNTLRRELELSNVSVCHQRLEDSREGDFPVPPSTLTTRAVGDLAALVTTSAKLLKGPRKVLLFLSVAQAQRAEKELEALRWDSAITVPWYPDHQILLGRLA